MEQRKMKIPYSYLNRQFDQVDDYLEEIRQLVKSEELTLGKAVEVFEQRFAQLCGLPYAVGVGSGTDALILSMEILGIKAGDEVITAPNTFIATVGAIVATGATPVFVDNNEKYAIAANKIESAITPRTKAIIPVHLTGCPADMPAIMAVANKHHLLVIEDAAQSILASIDGQGVGSWGDMAIFSLHPLKNLNVWGDGGVIVTRNADYCDKLRLYRNHGLKNRDEAEFFGKNCRLDALHAVIGSHLMDDVYEITQQRIKNAQLFDQAFRDLRDFITIPPRQENIKQVYHTYVIQVKERDALLNYLIDQGIEAKVHYPIPLHLQKASKYLGYKRGDFPVCERHCRTILTLPVHQHLTEEEKTYMVDRVRSFYLGRQKKGVEENVLCARG